MLQTLLCTPNNPYHQIIRFYSNGRQTYYDVLNLKRNCTTQEIRDAFIKLSKEVHPDTKGSKTDPKDTADFVKISEAYQVLSKPSSRDAYDQTLLSQASGRNTTTGEGFNKNIHRPWEIKPDFNKNPGPYYGIKGLKKVSNGKVVMVLIVFTMLSVSLGFLSVKQSFILNQSMLDVRSKEAAEHHAAVRENARKFGNDEQLKRMVDRYTSRTT